MDVIDLSNNIPECTICFYPITNDKYVTRCFHTFHHSCILEWSLERSVCPLCNSNISIPEFNDSNYEIEMRNGENASLNLVETLEFQRYLEQVERHRQMREREEEDRIREIETRTNSTILVIGNYEPYNSDEEDSNNINQIIISPGEKIRIHFLIFIEFSTTIVIINFTIDVIQLFFIIFSFISIITYRIKCNKYRFLSLVFKSLFILYTLTIFEDVNPDSSIAIIPWMMLSLIK